MKVRIGWVDLTEATDNLTDGLNDLNEINDQLRTRTYYV